MANEPERSSPPKALFEVFTPEGLKPYVPFGPEPRFTPERTLPENPLNPRGGPSPSLPQQASPIGSRQGVLSEEELALPQHELNSLVSAQDGLAPDNPYNPKGTPDYIVETITDPDAETTPHQLQPNQTPVANTPITLTITGMGFDDSCTVSIDGTPQTVNFVNQNRLTVEYTPNTAGTFPVHVDDDLHVGDLTVTEEGADG